MPASKQEFVVPAWVVLLGRLCHEQLVCLVAGHRGTDEAALSPMVRTSKPKPHRFKE